MGQELQLPSGAMHLSVRLGATPVRIFGNAGQRVTDLGMAVVGGVRDRVVRKEVTGQESSVGAMLRPGAVELLSNTPAGALAHRHTRLDELGCPSELAELRERLEAAVTATDRLDIFEEMLARRLPKVRGIDPLIAHMLAQLDRGAPVLDMVRDIGYSHRHLARTFTLAVGIPPKSYQRLRRFNRLLELLQRRPPISLAEAANAYGYADQAHMNRDFLQFTGLTPGHYCRIAPEAARHVAVPADFVDDQLRSRRARALRANPSVTARR